MKIEKLIAIGGNEWEGYGKHRVYFNNLEELYGLEIDTYNSGNVRSAKLNGKKISNSTAKWHLAKLNGKLYFDVIAEKWAWQDLEDDVAAELIVKIEER